MTDPPALADAQVAPIAALLADPARGAMLWALSDGRALTPGELARVAQLGAPTVSAHLARLVNGGLLSVARQGRHRYYRLTDPARTVAALEALAVLAAPVPASSLKVAHAARGVRTSRICYDHIAGRLGVAIADALVARGALIVEDARYEMGDAAAEVFGALGLDLDAVARAASATRRPLARACLDWSERRYHLAGALGAALAARLFELAWIERMPASRALRITNVGRRGFSRVFGVRL